MTVTSGCAAIVDAVTPTRLLVIGAQKAGTQSLAHYLDAQPRVQFSARELNFFSDDRVWARGLDWYDQQLAPRTPDVQCIGETSPSYSMAGAYPHAASRIAQTWPDVRLVYVLRDPVERMRSAYQHGLASGAETRPMRTALLEDDFYLDASCYAAQIHRYLELLPRESLKLVRSEDLRRRREEVVADVLAFAGVTDPVAALPDDERNVTARRRVPRRWAVALGGMVIRHGWERRVPARLVRWREEQSPLMTRAFRPRESTMPDDVRAELVRRLRPDVAELRQWLGNDFDCWGLLD